MVPLESVDTNLVPRFLHKVSRYTATLGWPLPPGFWTETLSFDASGPVLSESLVVAGVTIDFENLKYKFTDFRCKNDCGVRSKSIETFATTGDSLRTGPDASKPNVSARKSSGEGYPKVAV